MPERHRRGDSRNPRPPLDRLGRLRVYCAVCAVVWLLRLFLVQVATRDRFLNPTGIPYTKKMVLSAEKGELHDRNGKVLARCAEVASVSANPQLITQPAEVAALLAPMLGLDAAKVTADLSRRWRKVPLRRDVPADLAAKMQPLVKAGILSLSESPDEPSYSVLVFPPQLQCGPSERQRLALALGMSEAELEQQLGSPQSMVRVQDRADATTAERVEALKVAGVVVQRNAQNMARTAWLEPVPRVFDSSPEGIKLKPEVVTALEPLWQGVESPPKPEDICSRAKAPFVYLARQLPVAFGDAVAAKLAAEKVVGVEVHHEWTREYPQGDLARLLLGRVDVDERGTCGLEGQYDHLMSGVAGWRMVTVDARGVPILQEREERREPRHGKTVELTLDTTMQGFAQESVAAAVREFDANWGLAVVVDPLTGEVYALADFANAAHSQPEMVRPLGIAYEPGSVMKPIVVSAALEEGVTRADEDFYCSGRMQIGNRVLTCIKPHGYETVANAVRDSCNMTMVQVAARLGQEKLEPFFRRFGLFERTGLALENAEARGGIFVGNDTGRWGQQKLATVSYGKGIQCSAVEIVRAYCALLNGGSLAPLHLVRRILDHDGRLVVEQPKDSGPRVISEQVAARVKAMMREVIADKHGTGHSAESKLYNLGGKTGTSVAYSDKDNRVVSMIGFGPFEQTRLVVLVSICEPRLGQRWGSSTCGEAMRNIIERCLQYMSVPALPGATAATTTAATKPEPEAEKPETATKPASKPKPKPATTKPAPTTKTKPPVKPPTKTKSNGSKP